MWIAFGAPLLFEPAHTTWFCGQDGCARIPAFDYLAARILFSAIFLPLSAMGWILARRSYRELERLAEYPPPTDFV